ncbi:uncharacterized protein BX664DRAFT_385878 [Halteromyces radiatus]|uniref:uncharacterized protein n=1 Tax=Halteromyces radiatus TaxID=101107 RepID=UPI00221F788E|nr:uncharacterized protein BX664DRAFT_385878 [Halteromyces radiatus]KAI8089380.1 hypothetical protein BX664DRAFT_385878 [Halteromyces radiatus]
MSTNLFTFTGTPILWLIVLTPVLLSVMIYFCVRCITSKLECDDEEISVPCFSSSPSMRQHISSSLPPPSYFASHRDRLFRVHLLDQEEKILGYSCPPSYEVAVDPENMPLDKLKLIIQNQRIKHPQ